MANEHGEWIMHGVTADDPKCIHTVDELIKLVNDIGFLPLFMNEIEGFSVEERTQAGDWWCGDVSRDPWEWRGAIAGKGEIAYGKFFGRKAGFISKEWFPTFANFRRDGYDFDSLWDDEKASVRCKKIMDLFSEKKEIFSYEIKEKAGFGKGGEKNFDGVITDLQMMTYLCVRDFKRKKNKQGIEYGWAVALYTMPEALWGYDYIASRYKESPQQSRDRITDYMKKMYPGISEKQIKKVFGI